MDKEEQKEEQVIESKEKSEQPDNSSLETQVEEEKILRPTTPSEELLRQREKDDTYKKITAKVEQYNFNQGFKNSKMASETLVEVKDNKTPPETTINEKIDIKPPRKKNKVLPLLLILIVLLSGGTYYYLNFMNKKSSVKKTEQEPVVEEEKETQNKTTCLFKVKNDKQNSIIEYVYYDKEDKLQAYSQTITYEYLEETPSKIKEECEKTNKSYEGYEGYTNVCIQNDELSYSFKTEVDLNKLEEKTLTFDNNTITITSSLDDDTKELKEEYEKANYECTTEEVAILEEYVNN